MWIATIKGAVYYCATLHEGLTLVALYAGYGDFATFAKNNVFSATPYRIDFDKYGLVEYEPREAKF